MAKDIKLNELRLKQATMQYFRNYELANAYHVSQATVGKWVEAAKQGKLEVALTTHEGRRFIANTTQNIVTIEHLVEDRRKYRNMRGVKIVAPSPEFYKTYSKQQIHDIVLSIQKYREIPREYGYLGGGASIWDRYATRCAAEATPSNLTSTISLLESSRAYIDGLLAGYKRVNIIDLGVGNALPIKGFLGHIISRNNLGRYIGIDISASMLDVACRNLREWFGGGLNVEGHERDLARDRFSDLLAGEHLGRSKGVINLVLFLGSTLANLRDQEMVLKTISDSLGVNDVLIQEHKLDTASSRRFFDFYLEPGFDLNGGTGRVVLAPSHAFTTNLLNIDKSLYDVEMGYDDKTRQRYICVRLRVKLIIKFDLGHVQQFVELDKGESLLVWRAWQNTASQYIDLLQRSGLDWIHASQTKSKEYILTVSRGSATSSLAV